MVLGKNENDSFVLNIDRNKIRSSTELTVMKIKFERELKFKSHL